jgi:hypothetical protein
MWGGRLDGGTPLAAFVTDAASSEAAIYVLG